MLRIELLIDAKASLGEGPLWDMAERRSWEVPENIGSMEREAGSVFAIHGFGVRGLPEPRFAG